MFKAIGFLLFCFFFKKQKTIFFTESMLFFLFLYHFFKCNLYLHSDHNSSFSRKWVDWHLLLPSPPPITGWPWFIGLSGILVPEGAVGPVLVVPGWFSIPRLQSRRKEITIHSPSLRCLVYNTLLVLFSFWTKKLKPFYKIWCVGFQIQCTF